MGKLVSNIKWKIRHSLIDSDPVIRSEYSAFIANEHNASTIRKISCLAGLQLKRARNSLLRKERRTEWLKHSFSQQAERTPYSEITALLEKYDVVSFDIFDTLILRPFLSPKDIFAVAGEACGIAEFKNKRATAEQTARNHSVSSGKNSEVTLDDIYSELSDIEKKDELRAAEISAEFEFCRPNPYMQHIYRTAAGLGRNIVITTDMYLPADIIRKLLTACGYDDFSELLVSCEAGKSKGDGGLFKLLKNKYPDSSIIHFGDNSYSDILSARNNNIQPFFYESCIDRGVKYILPESNELPRSFIYGLIFTHLFNGDKTYSKWYEYGFGVIGISTAEYVLQIHQQCVEMQKDPDFVGENDQTIKNIYRRFFSGGTDLSNSVRICADLFAQDDRDATFVLPPEFATDANAHQKQEIANGAADFAVLYIEKAMIYPSLRTKQFDFSSILIRKETNDKETD